MIPKNEFVKYFDNRIAWLVNQWGEGVGVENLEHNNIVITSPANGLITIASDSPITGIIVSDISGKIVTSIANPGNEYQINCNSGIYIVNATTQSTSTTQKLAVK